MRRDLYGLSGGMNQTLEPELLEWITNILTDLSQGDMSNPTVYKLKKSLDNLISLSNNNIFEIYGQTKNQRNYWNSVLNRDPKETLKELGMANNMLGQAHDIVLDIRDALSLDTNTNEVVMYYTNLDGFTQRLGSEKLQSYGRTVKNKSGQAVSGIAAIKIAQDQIKKEKEFTESEIIFSQHYSQFNDIIHKGIVNKFTTWEELHLGKMNSRGSVNQGHIAEAFEGHFQHDDKGQITTNHMINHIDAYIHFWYAYNNKDAWWKGGDIGNIQVKSTQTLSGELSLGSRNSIKIISAYLCDIFNYNPKTKRFEFDKISQDIPDKSRKLVDLFFKNSDWDKNIKNLESTLRDSFAELEATSININLTK